MVGIRRVVVGARRHERLTNEPDHGRQLFPLGLFFIDVPKMDLDGHSWAPESFIDKNANYAGLLRAGKLGRRRKDGLAVSNYIPYFPPKGPIFPNSSLPMAQVWESHHQITHVHVLAVEVAGPALILEQPPATGTVSRGIVVDMWG